MGSATTDNKRNRRPDGFREMLAETDVYANEAPGGGTLKLRGRILRSPREGYFVLQPAGACCATAMEIANNAVLEYQELFRDKAGRATCMISVSAATRVQLVVPVPDRPAGGRAAPAATMDAAAGLGLWDTASWRQQGQDPGGQPSVVAQAVEHVRGGSPLQDPSASGATYGQPSPGGAAQTQASTHGYDPYQQVPTPGLHPAPYPYGPAAQYGGVPAQYSPYAGPGYFSQPQQGYVGYVSPGYAGAYNVGVGYSNPAQPDPNIGADGYQDPGYFWPPRQS